MAAMRTLPTLAFALMYVASAAAMPLPCGTAEKILNGPSRSRPETEAWVDSEIYPIRVHYLHEDSDLVMPTLEAAEYSWQIETEEWGWEPPGPDYGLGGTDDLDIYLYDTSAGGYCSPEEWEDTGTHIRCTSHVVINRQMDETSIRSTVSHELNHVFQVWTDCVEDLQMLEASATLAEDYVYPEIPMAWYAAGTYQQNYWMPLDYWEYGNWYQYGTFVFLQYIVERFGDGTPVAVREIWEDANQSDYANSNSWMASLERWLEGHWVDDLRQPLEGETYLEVAWQDWGEWRYFMGENWDGLHLTHGSPDSHGLDLELGVVGTASKSSLEEGPVKIELSHDMAELSSAAALIRHADEGWQVQVDLEAEKDRWALSLISRNSEEWSIVDRVRGEVGDAEAHASVEILPDVDEVLVVIAQVGDGWVVPTDNDWEGVGAALTVSVDNLSQPDDDDATGDDDDMDSVWEDVGGDEESGCSCSSVHTSPAAATVIALLSFLVMARRRW